MTLIELNSVMRSYGDKRGLNGIDLQVRQGEVVGLIGPNGAGKSTLLRIMLGLIKPSAGKVAVFGVDPWVQPELVKARTGYVSESRDEQERASIAELLALHQSLYPEFDRDLAKRLLGPLASDPKQRIHQLSKGQAGRAMLACAMAHRPELLLLDEPAGGLDPSLRRDFLEHAIEVMSEAGTTIVLSSHYLNDIERIANRVVVLEAGKVRLDAELDALREEYCLALFDVPSGDDAQRITMRTQLDALDGFLAWRVRHRRAQAVFHRSADAARAALATQGIDATCTNSNLEEVYIALVGDVQ